MDFSLFFFAAEDSSAREQYRLLLEASALADEMGFRAVWTPERHFSKFGGSYPNPALTSAAVASVTRRILLRAGSVVLPLHNPIRVVEDFSVVDNLSNGRVEISCVSGWHPDDYVIAPDKYTDRDRILAEGIATIKQLWGNGGIVLPNGSGIARHVSVYPRPVQPQLRIWRVCQRPDSCRWAGENGIDTLTSTVATTLSQLRANVEAFKSGARASAHQAKLALMIHTFIGKHASSVAWPAYRRYLEINMEFQRSAKLAESKNAPSPTPREVEDICKTAFARLMTTHGLIGDVDECVPKVDYLKALGVDEIACLIDFGIEADQVLTGLEDLNRLRLRFAEH